MKYAQVVYKGADDRIGRFGTVKNGQTITLTESEYDCVREDDRYNFEEWVQAEERNVKPAGTNTEKVADARSGGTVWEPSEASRVAQEVDVDKNEDADVDAEEEIESYEELTVKQLKAEIDARNALLDEEDQIVPDGTKKADLVDALEANDADE
jgi:hypothetical protein